MVNCFFISWFFLFFLSFIFLTRGVGSRVTVQLALFLYTLLFTETYGPKCKRKGTIFIYRRHSISSTFTDTEWHTYHFCTQNYPLFPVPCITLSRLPLNPELRRSTTSLWSKYRHLPEIFVLSDFTLPLFFQEKERKTSLFNVDFDVFTRKDQSLIHTNILFVKTLWTEEIGAVELIPTRYFMLKIRETLVNYTDSRTIVL